MSDAESAAIIMGCISEHARSHEKLRLQTVYLCETNNYRVNTLKEAIKKHGRGVEYVDSSLPGNDSLP